MLEYGVAWAASESRAFVLPKILPGENPGILLPSLSTSCACESLMNLAVARLMPSEVARALREEVTDARVNLR